MPPRVHEVHAKVNVPRLARAGSSLELEIFAEGEKIGTLELGRGSLFWRGGKRVRRKKIEWSRFAELMDQIAYGEG